VRGPTVTIDEGLRHFLQAGVDVFIRWPLKILPLTKWATVLARVELSIMGLGLGQASDRRFARFEEIIVFHVTPTP
jgi:hypothetical protein